jgi:parallel beta helix pectate lyase-like protein
MNARRVVAGLGVWVLSISPVLALANRVFVSARSGNNANSCDNIATPCQTFAGAVTQLNPDGEVIVLDSGGYGPVTITQGVTIEAPAGVTAFVHPPSGDAITINAGSSTVTLRGLTLNGGVGSGVTVNSVGTLNVENCSITGLTVGIQMNSAGRLNVKGTDIKACAIGVHLFNSAGVVQASIAHCHLDGNGFGFEAQTTSPGSSTTTASHTTANNNSNRGWICGNGSSGIDVLNLEWCTGSENGLDGLFGFSSNTQSVARYSNCAFANNLSYGVRNNGSGTIETRGTNTITGNGLGATIGVIGSFLPM